jgi:uncharacterized protein
MIRMLVALAFEISLAAGAAEVSGETPLMTAAYHGDVKAMRALLDRGAKVDDKTQYGMTALYYACGATPIADQPYRGSPDAVRLLLDRGADPNAAATRTGHTPLMTAVDNDSLEDVKLLVAHGAAVNARDTYGGSALADALARRRWPIAAFLVERGADVNAVPDVNGQTPLMIAIAAVPPLTSVPADGSDPRAGKALLDAVDVVKSLLDRKAEINPRGTNNQTPLTLAATQCHALVVRDLLERGAEVNARSKTMAGATALILAARCGNLPMAGALLAKGADVNLRDDLGRAALDLAEKNQQEPMIELLEKAGAKAVDARPR